MPIAAVPKYLGADFKDASPGMRFGHFLPIWTTRQDQESDVNQRASARSREGQEVAEMLRHDGMDATIRQLSNRERKPLAGLWDKNDFAAKNSWKNICALTDADAKRMQNLLTRQSAAFATALPCDALRIEAQSVAPFTTGLGNEHPLENGFAFLNPYGLPYLPGSGVKGVLRQAARELASGEWGEHHDWNEAKTIPLMQGEGDKRKPVLDKKNQPVRLSLLDILFGRETDDGDKEHLRGALTFWDVIPQIKGNSLAVEIMTPHQSHYYQKGATPHDSGSPIPISFLTIPPGSGFTFFITCNTELLTRHAPELAENQHWKTLLQAAFEHAFAWLGFGAKTAVGYGTMQRDSAAEQTAEHAQAAAEQHKAEEARRATLSPEDLAHEADLHIVRDFRNKLEAAKIKPYQPGSAFDQERLSFMKTALNWEDKRSRLAAGELLAETMTKTWGTPGKKERKQEISTAINQLKGEA